MEKRFYVDEKVTIWRRTWYSSDDKNSQEKLIESVKGISNDFTNSNMEDSEVLYETEELMSLEDNDGQSTIEVFTEDGKMIWSNGKQ